MASPLGKYSDLVAAIVAVGIVAAYLAALMIAEVQGITPDPSAIGGLKDLALIAVGAVFTLGGKAQGQNGTKDLALLAHARLDAMSAVPAAPTP